MDSYKCISSAKQPDIQKIIDNLQISTLEYRNESDHDVLPYVHEKKIELIKVLLVCINNVKYCYFDISDYQHYDARLLWVKMLLMLMIFSQK